MALGYHVCDVVTKKDFRIHPSRYQESVLVKQSIDKKDSTQPRHVQ
jgi:hypothetical protein